MKQRWLLFTFLSVILFASPAEAASLQTWRFDPKQNRLDFTTDDAVQPIAKLIANPTRLVVDLPGTTLGHRMVKQSLGNTIKALRVGQPDSRTTRLVVELAPGYALDPQKVQIRGESRNHWLIQLPSPQLTNVPLPVPEIKIPVPQVATVSVSPGTFGGLVPSGRELAWLHQRIEAFKTRYPSLQSGMFFLDMDTGNYLDIRGSKIFPAASIIKLPILIAFFQDVDAGKVKLNETLVMRPELIASGSGTMQDLAPWSKFSALTTVTKMITISDNTATNMIIKRLGGSALLNRRFRSWGLQNTVIHNLLPDLSGTNTTNSKDLVRLLALLAKNKLVSSQSQSRALDILRRTTTKTLLPAGLGPGAVIAHKTGDIGFAIGDAGIIDMPNGKRYLAAVLVKRPYDDVRGRNFIRQLSQMVYTYLNRSALAPSGIESFNLNKETLSSTTTASAAPKLRGKK